MDEGAEIIHDRCTLFKYGKADERLVCKVIFITQKAKYTTRTQK